MTIAETLSLIIDSLILLIALLTYLKKDGK